jgi:hypothetical protein
MSLSQLQSHIDNDSPVHTSITLLTQQLQSLEALELPNTNIRPQNELRTPRPRTQHSTRHKPNVLRSPRPFNQANMITQSKKLRTIKCWGCGQGHSLRDCTNKKEKPQQTTGRRRPIGRTLPEQTQTPQSLPTPQSMRQNPPPQPPPQPTCPDDPTCRMQRQQNIKQM